MLNPHDQSVLLAGLRAVRRKMANSPDVPLPHGATLSALAKHGGLYTFLDPEITNARIAPMLKDQHASAVQSAIQTIRSAVENFFYKLVPDKPYTISSDLMSFIAFPHDGVAYEAQPDKVNDKIPAVFTFVGQFIDHDLTMNAVNLTIDQSGAPVVDNASPIIDLDSVYGPRKVLNNAMHDADGKPTGIFDGEGKFVLHPVKNGFDLPRFDQDGPTPTSTKLRPARILDARNDENQIILQIHILVMRVHNKLISHYAGQYKDKPVSDLIDFVRERVVLNWQSLVLHDFMSRIIRPDILKFILEEIKKPDYGKLLHKPYRNLVDGSNATGMPHEFAIGFRFGHSMLRPSYKLNGGDAIPLFNNRNIGGVADLRGSCDLQPSHVIDWDIFYPKVSASQHDSLPIDGKVTASVFDLPETAIPDDIKFIGNLAHRNLIRSRTIGVTSGEELADFYAIKRLVPSQIVDLKQHPEAQTLFTHDGGFKTPLWYYLLKEAEVQGKGEMLGELGSRLVGEVLAGALYYGNHFKFDDNFKSEISEKHEVTLRDLIDFAAK